tara:strand:+ start:1231 stop:1443 length:213 start_codon:yes stop_codon:yes gene_type:complete
MKKLLLLIVLFISGTIFSQNTTKVKVRNNTIGSPNWGQVSEYEVTTEEKRSYYNPNLAKNVGEAEGGASY